MTKILIQVKYFIKKVSPSGLPSNLCSACFLVNFRLMRWSTYLSVPQQLTYNYRLESLKHVLKQDILCHIVTFLGLTIQDSTSSFKSGPSVEWSWRNGCVSIATTPRWDWTWRRTVVDKPEIEHLDHFFGLNQDNTQRLFLIHNPTYIPIKPLMK